MLFRSGDCCNPGLQMFHSTSVKCAEEDGCADPSFCTGTSEDCPEKNIKSEGELCGDPNAICQFQGVCDGVSKECPEVFKPNTTVCGKPSIDCLQDYFCTGTSNTCNETDILQPGGFICSVGKCSGFDTTCSRKIGSTIVKFGMNTNVTTEGLADGITEVILGGNKQGLLRIQKTDSAKGISVTVELTNVTVAEALYGGLKKTGKLGDYGNVTDVSFHDMFEAISLTSLGNRAELSTLMKLLVFLFVFLCMH